MFLTSPCHQLKPGAGVGGGSSLGGEGVSVGGVGSNESEALIDAAFVDIFDTVVSEAVAGVKAQMMLDEKDDSANGKEVFVACRAQLRYQVLTCSTNYLKKTAQAHEV